MGGGRAIARPGTTSEATRFCVNFYFVFRYRRTVLSKSFCFFHTLNIVDFSAAFTGKTIFVVRNSLGIKLETLNRPTALYSSDDGRRRHFEPPAVDGALCHRDFTLLE